jgi:hypothetical protein
MEPFTLAVWLLIGPDRYQPIPNLSRADCLEVERTQLGAKASCWGPLRPHICSFGACWPTEGRGNSLLAVPLRPR